MKTEIILIVILIVIFGCGITLGWSLNDLNKEIQNKRILNGLYIPNRNYSEAQSLAYSMDNSGEWVCVNVDKTMTYPVAYNTCIHECSHAAYSEIFAVSCENNVTKCEELVK